MSRGSTLLWECSIALFLIAALLQWLQSRDPTRRSIYRLLFAVTIFVTFAYAASQIPNAEIQSKGESEQVPWLMIGLMYVSMVLGIVAQSFYFNESVTPSANWIKPLLASPIIFIPLVSSYQSSLTNMPRVTIADLMILLVSFQNGFFWKVVFDKQAEVLGKQRT